MADARDNLENRKKWVRMPFDQGDKYQATNKLQDFENAFSNSRGSLDAAYIKETEKYIDDLKKELAVLAISDEYNQKVNNWRSTLRRTETFVADHDPSRGPCGSVNEYNRVAKEIEATISKPELMVCKELKQFSADWPAIKAKLEKMISDLELKGEYSDVERPIASFLRTLNSEINNLPSRSNYTNPNENVERAITNVQTALAKLDGAKWASFGPAQQLTKDVHAKVAEAYAAIGKSAPAPVAPKPAGIPEGLQCRKGHLLDKQPTRNCNCDVCSRSASGSLTCKACDYDMCLNCAAKAIPPTTPPVPISSTPTYSAPAPSYSAPAPTPSKPAEATIPEGLQCKKGHVLEKCPGRNCSCDECRRSATGSMNCKPCDYDMCFACAQKATPPKNAPVSHAAPAARSTPSYSTPTPSYSAPTPSYSAPTPTPSYSSPAPSSSSSQAYNPAQESLESKKKYLRMTFDSGDANQCEYKVKDFETTFANSRGSLPPAYVKETEKYIEDIKNEVKGLAISREYGQKVESWKSQLRGIESNMDSYNMGQGSCPASDNFKRVSADIDSVANRQELMICKDLKVFIDEWKSSRKATMTKRLEDFDKSIDWFFASSPIRNWFRPLDRDIRTIVDKSHMGHQNPVDNLQKTVEAAQADLDKLDRAKWGNYGPAKEVIKQMEDKIAEAFKVMGVADSAAKVEKNAKNAAEDAALADKINAAPRDIANALNAGKCSYSVTGATPKRQPYFSCEKCGKDYALCIACKRNGDHPADHHLVLQEGTAYCSCAHGGKCATSGHAGATRAGAGGRAKSSDYQTTTFEEWVPGSGDKPIGRFDATSRQCKLDLRSPLQIWNRWADDFNNAWEEYLKYDKQMKSCDPVQWEWNKNQVESYLQKAGDYPKNFRTSQSQIAEAAPGGTAHPAVKVVEGEIKKAIEIVRDARDALDEYADKYGFANKVEAYVANARAAYKEATANHTSGESVHRIDDYKGDEYRFGNNNFGGQYFLHDVLRIALGECEKAKAVLASNPLGKGHPKAAETEQLIKDSKAAQEALCLKWALKYLADGNIVVARRFREALQQTLGDVASLKQIDKAMQEAEEKAKKAQAVKDAQDQARSDQQKQERAAEESRMAGAWKTPYTGGKVYCDKEEWVYNADGSASCGGFKMQWTGQYLTGTTNGNGDWNETTFRWRANSRDIYSFQYRDKEFATNSEEHAVWKWDGTSLQPTKDNWKIRNVRFDGKVPLPVLLAIALRPWAEKRIQEASGAFLCKSALFSEGVQAKICDKCSRNNAVRCAVCRDGVPFPRDPAIMCKYCANRISSCVKCNGSFANNAAFLCDKCKMAWNGKCIKTK